VSVETRTTFIAIGGRLYRRRPVTSLDVAVIGQDPSFGGGVRAQAEAFLKGTRRLGRKPTLLYHARRPSLSLLYRTAALRPRRSDGAIAFPAVLPELDGASQWLTGRRMARAAAGGRSLWVVATTASVGYAAPRSGQRYACWLGTSLDSEWAGRLPGLARSRRLAVAANAPVLRRLERSVIRSAALVLATSPASRASVATAGGVAMDDVGLLPIPVDIERFALEPEPAWRERLSEPLLVFVGRASDPRKNLGLLLDAFRLLRQRLPAARLRLVGAPPDEPPEGVEVAGTVDDVAPLVREAALFVLPSLQEGFGVAVCEALACGVPALVTPCGGPEELVRASGGGRVLAGFEPEELASEAEALLTQPDALVELRRRGRAYVEREHGYDIFTDRLAAAFADLEGRD
jgi:glycosyltransferase involved in cell wall biosynthesis